LKKHQFLDALSYHHQNKRKIVFSVQTENIAQTIFSCKIEKTPAG
jgi:hypothetical protein